MADGPRLDVLHLNPMKSDDPEALFRAVAALEAGRWYQVGITEPQELSA